MIVLSVALAGAAVFVGKVRRTRCDELTAGSRPRSRIGRRWRGVVARRRRVGDQHLADALDAVGSSLRSGATVPRAVAEVAAGPGATVGFGPLSERLERGAQFDAAIREWAGGVGAPGAGLVAAVLGLAVDHGGRAAEAVDGVVATLRARTAVAAEGRALATQATASVGVLVAAPVVFGVLAASVDPRVGAFFVSPVGAACVASAALLDAAGAWWMVRLTGRVVG